MALSIVLGYVTTRLWYIYKRRPFVGSFIVPLLMSYTK